MFTGTHAHNAEEGLVRLQAIIDKMQQTFDQRKAKGQSTGDGILMIQDLQHLHKAGSDLVLENAQLITTITNFGGPLKKYLFKKNGKCRTELLSEQVSAINREYKPFFDTYEQLFVNYFNTNTNQ